MLKKLPLYLIILILIVIIFFLWFLTRSFVSSLGVGSKITETKGTNAKITQAYVSISAQGADINNDTKPDRALLMYSPLVNITTTKEISKFEIKNVKLTNNIKGDKSYITWPKHYRYGQSSNSFYESMDNKQDFANRKDEGRTFSYNVVDVPGFTDEIGKWGGYVDFRYTVYGLGKDINYENIMNTAKVYAGGKELQYAGFKQSDINSPIEFDLVITFTDKTKAVKHFSLTSDFTEIYNQGFSFKYNSDEYVGKEF